MDGWMDTGFILGTAENSLCGHGLETTISRHLIIKLCIGVQKIIPKWIKLGFEGSCVEHNWQILAGDY